VYTKLPATLAVAFNWVLLNAEPYVIAAGALHVMVGTLIAVGSFADVMVTRVDALRFCGEVVVDAGDDPAGAAST
jgi:hypothetical protein